MISRAKCGMWSGHFGEFAIEPQHMMAGIRPRQFNATVGEVVIVTNGSDARAPHVRQTDDSRHGLYATMDGCIERSVLAAMMRGDGLEGFLERDGRAIDLDGCRLPLADFFKSLTERNAVSRLSTRRRLEKRVYHAVLGWFHNLGNAYAVTMDESLHGGSFVLAPPVITVGAVSDGYGWREDGNDAAHLLPDSADEPHPTNRPAEYLGGLNRYPTINGLRVRDGRVEFGLLDQALGYLDMGRWSDAEPLSALEADSPLWEGCDPTSGYWGNAVEDFLNRMVSGGADIEWSRVNSAVVRCLFRRLMPPTPSRMSGHLMAGVNASVARTANTMVFTGGADYEDGVGLHHRAEFTNHQARRRLYIGISFDEETQTFAASGDDETSAWDTTHGPVARYGYRDSGEFPSSVILTSKDLYDLKRLAWCHADYHSGGAWRRVTDFGTWEENGSHATLTIVGQFAEVVSVWKQTHLDDEIGKFGPVCSFPEWTSFELTMTGEWADDTGYPDADATGCRYPCDYAIANGFAEDVHAYAVSDMAWHDDETQSANLSTVGCGERSPLSVGKQEDAFKSSMKDAAVRIVRGIPSVIAKQTQGRVGRWLKTRAEIDGRIFDGHAYPPDYVAGVLTGQIASAFHSYPFRDLRLHFTRASSGAWAFADLAETRRYDGDEWTPTEPLADTPSVLSSAYRLGETTVGADIFERDYAKHTAHNWELAAKIPLWLGAVDWHWQSLGNMV